MFGVFIGVLVFFGLVVVSKSLKIVGQAEVLVVRCPAARASARTIHGSARGSTVPEAARRPRPARVNALTWGILGKGPT